MARVVMVLNRLQQESELDFKRRCADALQAAVVTDPAAYTIGRTHVTPEGLESSCGWGTMLDGLPSEQCVIAWWPQEDAKKKWHRYDAAELALAVARAESAG